jgi:hypothetical protein
MFPANGSSAFLCLKEIVKLGLCIQVFLEPENPLVLDDIPDFTFGIEKVSEFPGPCGTGLHTGGVHPPSDPLDTKSTLIDGTLHPGSVSEVMNRGIDLLLGKIGFCPVEDPSFVRTGCHAVSASNAPVVIDHDEPIGLLPGGMDRAYLYARRVLAVLALNRKVDKPLFRYEGSFVVMFGVFEIDQATPLESENPDPVELMLRARVIIFFDTGIDASSTTDAPGEIQAISPEGIGEGFLRADLEFLPIFVQVSLFQFGDDPLLFLRVHLSEMLLEKVIGLLL